MQDAISPTADTLVEALRERDPEGLQGRAPRSGRNAQEPALRRPAGVPRGLRFTGGRRTGPKGVSPPAAGKHETHPARHRHKEDPMTADNAPTRPPPTPCHDPHHPLPRFLCARCAPPTVRRERQDLIQGILRTGRSARSTPYGGHYPCIEAKNTIGVYRSPRRCRRSLPDREG